MNQTESRVVNTCWKINKCFKTPDPSHFLSYTLCLVVVVWDLPEPLPFLCGILNWFYGSWTEPTLLGIGPRVSGFVDQRLIHWVTESSTHVPIFCLVHFGCVRFLTSFMDHEQNRLSSRVVNTYWKINRCFIKPDTSLLGIGPRVSGFIDQRLIHWAKSRQYMFPFFVLYTVWLCEILN